MRSSSDPSDPMVCSAINHPISWLFPVVAGRLVRTSVPGETPIVARSLPPLRCRERGAIVATFCAGAMLAVYGGLVTGRHRQYRRHATKRNSLVALVRRGAAALRAPCQKLHRILHCRAVGQPSGLDLALWLVERFASPEVPKSPPRSNPISNTSAAAPSGAGSSLPCSFESKRVQSLVPAGIGRYDSP
jgi:hypothetical protein